MTFRRLLILGLVAVMAALVPMAQASPPDQTWIGGFYDNGDHDDVIVSATSTAATAETSSPDLAPTHIVVGAPPRYQPGAPLTQGPAPKQPRAPPSA